jgi:hypothetical protein
MYRCGGKPPLLGKEEPPKQDLGATGKPELGEKGSSFEKGGN